MELEVDRERDERELVPIAVPFLKNKKCEIGNFGLVNHNMTKSTFIKWLQPANFPWAQWHLCQPYYVM